MAWLDSGTTWTALAKGVAACDQLIDAAKMVDISATAEPDRKGEIEVININEFYV
jgi:hypothetical protein